MNPGLGLHYEPIGGPRGGAFAEIGAYRDSGRNRATFAALGYQTHLGRHFRLGGAIAVFHSRTYNDGDAFVGLVPLMTVDFGSFKLNTVYFPEFERFNQVDVFGFYISFPFWQSEAVRGRASSSEDIR